MTDSGSPTVLAVIPARGGSKRISRKNLRELDGRPLIAHTIDQAMECDRIDEAIVSTDDQEIKNTAIEYGGTVPFTRPASLATDTATSAAVVTHALDWFAERGRRFDIVCLLQVTSPLRTPEDIEQALDLLEQKDAQTVISTTEYNEPPQWAVTTNEEGYLKYYFEREHGNERSQDLPDLRHPNGAVFAAKVSSWREDPTFIREKTIDYEMPPERSVDIDEPWELSVVRCLYSAEES